MKFRTVLCCFHIAMSWQRKLKSLKLWEFCQGGKSKKQNGPLYHYWRFLKILFYLSCDIQHCAAKAIQIFNTRYNEAKTGLKKNDLKANLRIFHGYIHRCVKLQWICITFSVTIWSLEVDGGQQNGYSMITNVSTFWRQLQPQKVSMLLLANIVIEDNRIWTMFEDFRMHSNDSKYFI